MEPISAKVGNKIFAIETNLAFIRNRIGVLNQSNASEMRGSLFDVVESIQRSLEELKALKLEISATEELDERT